MRESASPASRMSGAPPADPSLIQQFSRRVAEDMTGRPLRVAGAVGRVAAKAGFPLRMSVGPARVGQGQVRPKAVARRVAGPAASTPYDVVAMRSRMDLRTPGEPGQLVPWGSASPRAARAVTSS